MTNEQLMLETLKSMHHLFNELRFDNAQQLEALEEALGNAPISRYFEGKRDAYGLAAQRIESAIKTLEVIA